jgi:hypothetical protein
LVIRRCCVRLVFTSDNRSRLAVYRASRRLSAPISKGSKATQEEACNQKPQWLPCDNGRNLNDHEVLQHPAVSLPKRG